MDRFSKSAEVGLRSLAPDAEHQMMVLWKFAQEGRNDGPQAALDAVSDHGIPHLLSNRETDLANAKPVRKGANVEHHEPVRIRATRLVRCSKLAGAAQPLTRRKHLRVSLQGEPQALSLRGADGLWRGAP